MANLYRNKLDEILTEPGKYQGSPGFQFALNSGMDGVARKYAAMGMGNSGNVLGAMSQYGTNLATQDYGNTVDRLGRLAGEQDQTDLGNKSADNAYSLGQGNLALGNKTADQNFGLGLTRADNDYTLGAQRNQNDANSTWLNYVLGADRNNIAASGQQNDYGLGAYNAQTGRGSAQANSWLGDQRNQREWYSVFPRKVIA